MSFLFCLSCVHVDGRYLAILDDILRALPPDYAQAAIAIAREQSVPFASTLRPEPALPPNDDADDAEALDGSASAHSGDSVSGVVSSDDDEDAPPTAAAKTQRGAYN